MIYESVHFKSQCKWFSAIVSKKTNLKPLYKQMKKVEVKNSILHQYFDSQQNIINFYLDKTPKSLILLKGKDRGKLTF